MSNVKQKVYFCCFSTENFLFTLSLLCMKYILDKYWKLLLGGQGSKALTLAPPVLLIYRIAHKNSIFLSQNDWSNENALL